MRKLIFRLILIFTLISSPVFAANFYPFSGALIGGGAGALDAKDGSGIALKDVAIVALDGDATYGNSFFVYVYHDFATSVAENAPFLIKPNANANANYAWLLVSPWSPDIFGGTKVTNKSSSPVTLTSAECNGIVVSSAAITFTLPVVAATPSTNLQVPIGTTVVIYSSGANVQTLTPGSGQRFIREGTTQSANATFTLASGAGNYVVLFADSASGWTTIGAKGTLAP